MHSDTLMITKMIRALDREGTSAENIYSFLRAYQDTLGKPDLLMQALVDLARRKL